MIIHSLCCSSYMLLCLSSHLSGIFRILFDAIILVNFDKSSYCLRMSMWKDRYKSILSYLAVSRVHSGNTDVMFQMMNPVKSFLFQNLGHLGGLKLTNGLSLGFLEWPIMVNHVYFCAFPYTLHNIRQKATFNSKLYLRMCIIIIKLFSVL